MLSNPGVSTKTRWSPWTGWLCNLTAWTLVHACQGWPVKVSIIFKTSENKENNVWHIAYMALAGSCESHESVAVIINRLVVLRKRVSAMTRSMFRRFAGFLMSWQHTEGMGVEVCIQVSQVLELGYFTGSYPAIVTIVRAGSILERGDVR